MLAFLLTFSPVALAGDEGALAGIPFGVAHFIWGKPGRGIMYASTQVVGITGAVLGTVKATEALESDDQDAIADWQIVAGSGVTLAALSYVIQTIDGSRLSDQRQAAQARLGVELFDRGYALAHPPVTSAALAVVP